MTGGLTPAQVQELLDLLEVAVSTATEAGYRALDEEVWQAAWSAAVEANAAAVTAIRALQWSDPDAVAGGPEMCRDCASEATALYRVIPNDPSCLDQEWLCTECAAADDDAVGVLWDGAS